MDDARKARPVSGEIMTGAPRESEPRAARDADVVDADYIVVEPAGVKTGQQYSKDTPTPDPSPQGGGGLGAGVSGSLSPLRAGGMMTGDPAAPSGMTMLAQSGNPVQRAATRGGPAFWAVGVTLAVLAFWVSGGHALVRQTAEAVTPAPQRAFSIRDVTSRVDASGARAVLFVDGEASNDGEIAALLPALAIHVTGNDGRVTRYNLGTAGRPLAPGEKFAFSSRLDVPKDGVKTVSVTFAE